MGPEPTTFRLRGRHANHHINNTLQFGCLSLYVNAVGLSTIHNVLTQLNRLLLDHSSQYHLGPVLKVLKNSSNFHHFLMSLREVNPENLRSLALTVYFLEAFKVLRIVQNFGILHFLLILES